MERFKKIDINRYEKLWNDTKDCNVDLVKINYPKEDDEEIKKIIIPSQLFTKIILEKRPEYIKFLPAYYFIQRLERGKNPWLQKTNYLGLAYTSSIDLFLDIEREYSKVMLLWIMLHEFRHTVQNRTDSIKSCIRNKNYKKWIEFMTDKNKDMKRNFVHVFHELLPAETDANIFACEMLDIEYPGSKFELTNQTLKLFKKERI